MTALIELDTSGGKQKVRIFSLRGCHLLAMFARTAIAKQFRKWVLDILDQLPQRIVNPFDDVLPELPPFQKLNSALLSELRRMSKSLAQAYLLECNVTPEYVNSQLSRLKGGSAHALPEPDNAMPLTLLLPEIPAQASNQDDKHYYFITKDFFKLCGDYDPTETARLLRSIGALKCYHSQLKILAPHKMFGARRPRVYAIRKAALAEFTADRV